MSEVQKQQQSDDVVTGKVVGGSGINLLPPTTEKQRQAESIANHGRIATAWESIKSETHGLVALLVFHLILSPQKSGDGDALDALRQGDGAIDLPTSALNKARTVFTLVQGTGVTDTDDDRWKGAMELANQRGMKSVQSAMGRKQSATREKVLREIAATGDMKERSATIAKHVPTTNKKRTPAPASEKGNKGTSQPTKAEQVRTAVDALAVAHKAAEAALKGKPTKVQRANVVSAIQALTALVAPATAKQVK